METRRVEGPSERTLANMSAWHRIMDRDGSTVAYVPDATTAQQLAAVDVLAKALREALPLLLDGCHAEDARAVADQVRAALRAAGLGEEA